MQLGDDVVLFDVDRFTMVVSLSTGYVIGLTPEGARICREMLHGDISDEKIAAVDENLLQHLKIGGFSRGSECRPLERTAYFHVTSKCNLHCAGCYSAANSASIACDVSLDEACRILDNLSKAGVIRLVVSGGEPFLRDDLPELVRYAKETCGIEHVDVLTNGTSVEDVVLGELHAYVDRVCVSFDGVSPDSDALIRGEQRFDTLVDTVRRIQQAGIHAHIVPTIHAGNIMDIQAHALLAQNLGATMNYSLLSAPEQDEVCGLLLSDESLSCLADGMLEGSISGFNLDEKNPVGLNISACSVCGVGNKSVSIAANGDIYPCHMLHREEYGIGNALEDDISAALEQSSFAPVAVDEIDGCSGCEVRDLCGGGCRARAVYATGSLAGKDPYCMLMKSFYQKMFRRMAA